MSNPIFNQFGNNNQLGNMNNIVRQFQAFKQNFHGDPQFQVQQLLNSGRISQEQYNKAVQMANAMQKMLRSI